MCSDNPDSRHRGRCLCGKVNFEVSGHLRDVLACHCGQCRRQTGLYYAATNSKMDNLTINGAEHITWYQSSTKAKRGFCHHCGSALFWKENNSEWISILAGAFDEPSGLKTTTHIFCADKGDFYEINDDLPQYEQGRNF